MPYRCARQPVDTDEAEAEAGDSLKSERLESSRNIIHGRCSQANRQGYFDGCPAFETHDKVGFYSESISKLGRVYGNSRGSACYHEDSNKLQIRAHAFGFNHGRPGEHKPLTSASPVWGWLMFAWSHLNRHD